MPHDEQLLAWAVATGRPGAERLPFWRDQLAADRRQLKASASA